MRKFGRNYFLSIQKNAATSAPIEFLVIPNELTVEFDINRHSLGSVNYAQIKIYNLSPQSANSILKNWNDFGLYKQVIFQAGYGDGPHWPMIFTGNASQVQSVREGNNFITTIQAFDGGFAYSNAVMPINFTTASDISRKDLITQIASTLGGQYHVALGAIGNGNGNFDEIVPRGTSYVGNPIDILKELTGGAGSAQVFIDQGRINILNKDAGEAIQVPTIPTISAETGLLGTPVREQTTLSFDTLLDSSLLVGQQIYLKADTAKNYSTNYLVVSLQHKGVISRAIAGEAITTIGVFCTALTPIPLPVAK